MRGEEESEPATRALIADDRTGAADAAVAFPDPVVWWGDGMPEEHGFLAVDIRCREAAPETAAARVADAARRLERVGARCAYLKIDSALRGPAGAMVAAAVQAGIGSAALVAPAFPAHGRRVEGGMLRTEGLRDGIDIGALLEAQGLCGLQRLATPDGDALDRLLARGCRWVLADAGNDADLDALARLCAARPGLLPVGSGGLAAAFAGRAPRPAAPSPAARRLAVLVGSPHAAAARQGAHLTAAGIAAETAPDNAARQEALWRDRRLPLVRVGFTADEADALSALGGRIDAALVTGGDTAAWLGDLWGARAWRLEGEAVPGAPWGRLVGGIADRVVLCAKSGGFGADDALARAAAFLRGEP